MKTPLKKVKVIPVPILPDERISIKEAAYLAGTTERTVRRWCLDVGIGKQAMPGAPMQVSALALEMLTSGCSEAIELLRENKRDHPMVLFFANRVGVRP